MALISFPQNFALGSVDIWKRTSKDNKTVGMTPIAVLKGIRKSLVKQVFFCSCSFVTSNVQKDVPEAGFLLPLPPTLIFLFSLLFFLDMYLYHVSYDTSLYHYNRMYLLPAHGR